MIKPPESKSYYCMQVSTGIEIPVSEPQLPKLMKTNDYIYIFH